MFNSKRNKHIQNVNKSNTTDINEALIKEIKKALHDCDHIQPFYGGQYVHIGKTTKILSYPTTEVLSSLEDYIRDNPYDHGVSIQ